MKNICVFCSSSDVVADIFKQEAKNLGNLLLNESISLIYGGAKVGMMGILAKTIIEGKGHVIGVIPELIHQHRLAEEAVSELIITEDMKSRKAKMAELSDAFIALPGGFGTLEELVEVITLKQLGYHQKPIVIINTSGFYDKLVALFEMYYDTKFAKGEYRQLYYFADNPEDAINYLKNYNHQELLVNKWYETKF
ncbi:MAG: TIGR00730 family Rossman fold protein [Bacteroidales bacterium]|nr:TIGR00730 family Rossman fold protein [Bacteroidales bacterium]